MSAARDGNRGLRRLDSAFGDWVEQQFGRAVGAHGALLGRLACAASHALHLKHTCLDLDLAPGLEDPVLTGLLADLDASAVAEVAAQLREAGRHGPLPLVLSGDGRRVWLQKYHRFETAVAGRVRALAGERRELTRTEAETLDRCFDGADSDEQKEAVRTALSHGLSIITGGPGTGKTWTVARLIAVLLTDAGTGAPRIGLAAPTGKAANRMKESLDRETAALDLPVASLPGKARTLHALLGIGRHSPHPRHDARNPLPLDVLVVDEASMVDLPMMHRLLQALAPGARLVLLGDRDQLASVEAGGVLAELCDPASGLYAGLPEAPVATIRRSRRYSEDSGIGSWARAINGGGPLPASGDGVRWRDPTGERPWAPRWLERVRDHFLGLEAAIEAGAEPLEVLERHASFQVLCALRRGPYGVSGINEMLIRALGHANAPWYPGRPVIITANDHERGVYNGDVGLVLPVRSGGETLLRACFLTGERDETGAPLPRSLSPGQMPPHETCYAVTVHKAQGSEYDEVLLVLPADEPEPGTRGAGRVVTRELLYTAVTRARGSVQIYAGRGVLEAALRARTLRMSGLGS